MKTLLALLAGSSLALFLSSCTEYSASGYYNDGYNSSYGSNSGYGYNSAVSVGIIRTSNSYWGYDPYRRSYYDYRTRRYYDQHRNTYCSSPPRRYTTAVYPSNYRSGRQLSCPPTITRVRPPSSHRRYDSGHSSHASHRSSSSSNYGRTQTSSSSNPSNRQQQTRGSQRETTRQMPVVIHRTPTSTRTQRPTTIQRTPTART
ncbi:hypothetical protein OAF44_03515, partial [Akkermansiaceae bacterium]|nr:hypothetical protein [Akkermansiaceae bacterium]